MTRKDLLGEIEIVEDDYVILFNLKVLLKNNDYEPITAINGVEALEVLSNLETSPDLILCDVTMPKMGGYELYQKVSKNPQWNRIPFVIVTAESEPEGARLDKELGEDDYITKPFNNKDLLAIITKKITQKRENY